MPAQLTRTRAGPCAAAALARADFGRGRVGDVAGEREAADRFGDRFRRLGVAVENGDARALGGEGLGRRLAQSRTAAGDDRRRARQFHCASPFVPFFAVGFSTIIAMPCPPPMQAEAIP